MPMDAVLILNPIAGRGKPAENVGKISHAFHRQGIKCETLFTTKAGDAERFASTAAAKGCDLVIVGGGDGTVNEVVNGLAGTETRLGILPVGTVNVLARELKIPVDQRKAIRIIAEGHVKNIDLGCANGRYFTLMAGFGFDAEVVSNVLQPIKDMLGSSAYILKGLAMLPKYEATDVVLEMPGKTYSTSAFLIMVANSSTYSYHLKIAPYATPDDGMLDVCVFERPVTDKIGFARQVADVFLRRHIYHRSIRYFRTSAVKVTSNPEIMVQLDGDGFGATPVDISIAPRILPIIVPEK